MYVLKFIVIHIHQIKLCFGSDSVRYIYSDFLAKDPQQQKSIIWFFFKPKRRSLSCHMVEAILPTIAPPKRVDIRLAAGRKIRNLCSVRIRNSDAVPTPHDGITASKKIRAIFNKYLLKRAIQNNRLEVKDNNFIDIIIMQLKKRNILDKPAIDLQNDIVT